MQAVVAGAGVTWDLVVDCIAYDRPEIEQDLRLFRDRAAQLVFISTDFVYEPTRRLFPQPEASCHYASDPRQEYGVKKRAAELALIEGEAGAMAWTILRPGHVYGPTSELGCLPEHGRDPRLIERLRAGEPLRLVGGGHFLQQPISAEDLGRLVVSVAGNPAVARRVFNAAGPEVVESRRYYEIVAEVLGVELQVEEVPVRGYLTEHPEAAPFLCHRVYDLRPLASAGLAVPTTPLRRGLEQHVAGLLARG